jgi:lipopolysaccharide biosynthesis glycosyltransferase
MKNLVYYLIYGKGDYFDLLESSINTLIKLGKYEGDILFICDKNNINEILNLNIKNKKYFLETDDSVGEMALNKFKIFDFELLNNYDNILYIDTDIFIINDINSVFSLCDKHLNQFHFSFENFNENESERYGYSLLTDDEKLKVEKKEGINAGLFLFKNNKYNINILKKIFNKNKYLKTACLDQPLVGKYFLMNPHEFNGDLTKITYFNMNKVFINDKDIIFIHFVLDSHSLIKKKYFKIYEFLLYNDLVFDDISLLYGNELSMNNLSFDYKKDENKLSIFSSINSYDNVNIEFIKDKNSFTFFNKNILFHVWTYYIPPFKLDDNFKVVLTTSNSKIEKIF